MPNNTIIQLKRTSTAGGIPTNLLANAELAYNLTDKRLFTTDTTGGAVFDAIQNTGSNFSITGTSVQLFIGNSTINSVSNSSFHKVQNSTVSSSISIANVVTTNVYASFYATGNIATMSQLGSGANSTNFLRGDGTFAVPAGGGGGTPGGANTQVQFNDSSTFAGSAGFVFDKTTNTVTVANTTTINTKLNVGVESGFSFGTLAISEFNGNVNTYLQAVHQNANAGTQASTDFICVADTGNDSVNYIDIGINSSTYSNATFNLTGSIDGYLYTSNSHLVIGTLSANEVIFHANGSTTADRKLTVNATAVTVNNISFIVGNSTVNSTINSTAVQVTNSTSNSIITPSSHFTGNSVANSVLNQTTLTIANATTNSVLSPALLTIGNSVSYGSFSNVTMLIASNSTVNSIITDASVTVQNSTSVGLLNPINLRLGNSTVNSFINSTALVIQSNSTANVTLTNIAAQLFVGNTSGGDIASPSGNSLSLFGKYSAGKLLPSFVGSSGEAASRMQPHIMHNQPCYLLPIPGGTTISALRTTSANTIAFTARTQASGNTFLSSTRVSQTTGTTAGTSISWRNSVLQWWRGNAAGLGGFYVVSRFGVATTTTNGRGFVGFKDSATILSNGAPSAQTNIIGFGFDSSNSTVNTLRVMSANATTANTIDLGAGFPVNTGNTDWYEAVIFAPPNGGTVQYQVTNLKNGNTAFGSFNQTNLPSTTTFLTWQFWGNNGADSAALVMDWGGVTIETPY